MIVRLLLLLLFLLPQGAAAAEPDYSDFARLPVQHEGRIKPLDTFARAMLYDFSGHESIDGLSAEAWLAETLFDPAQAIERPFFRIFRPELLDLPPRERKYYSYAELAPALQKKSAVIAKLSGTGEKEWSEDQRELMRLSERAFLYTQLLRSFSYVIPLNLSVPPALSTKWKLDGQSPLTLQQLRPYREDLQDDIREIIRKKGKDPSRYSDEERSVAQLGMNLQIFEQAAQDNVLLRIVPGAKGPEWFSPWALTEQGQGSPAGLQYLGLWENMARAYQTQDNAAWKQAAHKAAAKYETPEIGIEIAYNKARPLLLAGLAYLAAFFGIVLYSLRGAETARRLSFTMMSGGLLLHGAAITARILILDRAPVGTLYESVIFVAFVCVLVALAYEYLRKDGQGILVGTLSALLLLFIAGSFADGDTMKMLVAVLNTNFWLSTHVLCITMGYAWCLIASLLAHIWLVKHAFGRGDRHLATPVKILALIALLFTAVGTILGGIWADQSWGRFWGWDPKENGALLIVLWLVWAIHGQIGGQLARPLFMAAMAALSIVVGLAWFGVNLLSVGLHSYGFITGVATSLAIFCTAELILIAFLTHRAVTKAAS